MALDFTVIISVRQRFGDTKADEDNFHASRGLEMEAPFVGAERSYPFSCPGVNSGESAVLLFQSQGAASRGHHLEINGQAIFGGIPKSVEQNTRPRGSGTFRDENAIWLGSVMLVHPGVLQENNVLRIATGSVGDNLDDFVVDNVVLFFKTRGRFDSVGLPANVGASTRARAKRKPAKKAAKKKTARSR